MCPWIYLLWVGVLKPTRRSMGRSAKYIAVSLGLSIIIKAMWIASIPIHPKFALNENANGGGVVMYIVHY